MRPRMRSRAALKSRLEVYIIPRERVHDRIENLARERCVEHRRGFKCGGPDGVEDQLESKGCDPDECDAGRGW